MVISKFFLASYKLLCRTGLSTLFFITIMATVSNAADVTLAWERNSETAVIGYTLYLGTVKGVCTDSRDTDSLDIDSWDIDGQIMYTLTELTEGVTYYFAVTAYTDDDESDCSEEISHLVQVPETDSNTDDSDETDLTGFRSEPESECSDDVDCHSGHVCDLESGECVACLFDEHCDDGMFCNGDERCDRNVCQPGPEPCTNFERCDDDSDICHAPECLDDEHCDDGMFCNGEERCNRNVCQSGPKPCANFERCDDDSDICHAPECLDDVDCDDGIFCNGEERCVEGTCSAQAPVCGDNEYCVEDTDACWELSEITSRCLPRRMIKPMLLQRRCSFLVLENNSQCMAEADQREIYTTFPDDLEAAGVMVDASWSFTVFGRFLFIPVCIDQSAPSGEWLITVVNSCGALSQPLKEITLSSFMLQ